MCERREVRYSGGGEKQQGNREKEKRKFIEKKIIREKKKLNMR